MNEWDRHSAAPYPLKMADNQEFPKQYDVNECVPFNTVRTTKRNQRAGYKAEIGVQPVFVEKFSSFKLRIHEDDDVWFIKRGGRVDEIEKAPYVEFLHPDFPDQNKKKQIFMIPKNAEICVVHHEANIYFPLQMSLRPSDIPKDAWLYMVRDDKRLTQAENAPRFQFHGNFEQRAFFWIPWGYTSFFVSKKEIPNWEQKYDSTMRKTTPKSPSS